MRYERFIAIDNVCAWPNLTLLPNGDILAVIFNQPCHGRWEGDVDCWLSQDQGHFWVKKGVVAPHAPGTVRMNVGGGVTSVGDLVYIVTGWDNMKPAGQPIKGPHHQVANIIEPWICRSKDGGATWTQHVTSLHLPQAYGNKGIPFGKMVVGADGKSGLSVYGVNSTGPNKYPEAAYVVRSDDGGQTWNESSLIAQEHNETDLLVLDDGRWLAAARTCKEGHIDQYISEDDGRTWSFCDRLTASSQHPGHLLQLADGSILLTYGIRHRGLYGIGARLSEDGVNWQSPMVVVDFNNNQCGDGGYPSSVQVEDGTVVTAYYVQKTAEHHRYHVGVLRWEPRAYYQKNTSNYLGT